MFFVNFMIHVCILVYFLTTQNHGKFDYREPVY